MTLTNLFTDHEDDKTLSVSRTYQKDEVVFVASDQSTGERIQIFMPLAVARALVKVIL